MTATTFDICAGSLDKPTAEWGDEVKCADCGHWYSRSSRTNGPVKHWSNGQTFEWWRRAHLLRIEELTR